MKRFEPRIDTLIAALEAGIGAGETHGVRSELGLRTEADDEDVARSLVQIVSACVVATAGESPSPSVPSVEEEPPEEELAEERISIVPDASLLGQLEGRGIESVTRIDDHHTLLAVCRAGRLFQRREALRSIIRRIKARSFRGDEQKHLASAIYDIRDLDLEYELAAAKMVLLGRRAAKAEEEEWARNIARVEEAIVEFWEAASTDEPLSTLRPELRAQLILRLRDAPDLVATHVGALVESLDSEALEALLVSLRFCGDGRLVPSLAVAIEDTRPSVAMEAVRVLRRIDDPRVEGILREAYDRSPRDAFRALVAGALAEHGDHHALEYVRGLLDREDPTALTAALEALEALGTVEDADAVAKLLDHEERGVVRRSVRALARISDGRSLSALATLAKRSRSTSLRAEIERARDAILARMELRGEEPGEEDTVAITFAVDPERPRLGGKRFAAWRSFVIGHLWIALGATKAGLQRFERAAALRPGWYAPHIAMGMALSRVEQHSQALSAFRRAVEAERRRVERNPMVIRALARSFIARAEQVEREGRADVARGLVHEALSLDLRFASGPQRFELERRRAALKLGAG